MHLVVDHMAQLQHVDHAHGSRLVELLARLAVVQVGATATRNAGLRRIFVDLVERGPVEDRRGELQPQLTAGPAEHGLVNLPEVHTRRHAQRVEYDVDDRTVFQERHVLVAHDLRHDTLVAVAAGHLVAHAQLALFGDINLRELDDARRKLVPVRQVVLLTLEHRVQFLVFDRIVVDRQLDQMVAVRVPGPFVGSDVQVVELAEHLLRETGALGNDFDAEIVVNAGRSLVLEQNPQLLDQLLLQRVGLYGELGVHLVELRLLGGLALLAVLVRAAEQLLVDHDAMQRRLSLQRSVLHVAGLVAENRAKQLLLRRRIALALGRDLSDQDVARMHVRADANDAVLVQILRRFLADVRNVRSQLLDAALRIADLHDILVDMHRRENIVAHHALRNHDGILEIVSLPRHERHLQVTSESQLAVLGRIAFGQNLARHDLLTLADNRLERHRRTLVRLAIARQHVSRHFRIERNDLLVLRALVLHLYLRSVRENDLAIALRHDLNAAVGNHVLLQAGSDDRGLRHHQGHGLTHHVRSHQRAVRVVMLQERNQAGGDRRNLVRRHVHQVHLGSRHDREVAVVARLDLVGLQELALVAQRRVGLSDHEAFLLFGAEILNACIVQVDLAAGYLAVGRLDKAHVANLGVHAKRRDQTDIRTFRRLDRAEATVMGVVHVAHLETGPFARQAARSKSRQAALMRHLGQRVRLVHELRKLVGPEERVDDRRQRLRIDQVHRSEHLVVAHVHPLANRAGHPDETDAELVGQLLAYGTHPTVAQVVDVVDIRLRVDQRDQITDNRDHILLGQNADLGRNIQIELLVDSETSYVAQIVALVREEQLLDHVARRRLVGRLRVAKLAIDINDRLFLGVAGIFLQRIVHYGEIGSVLSLLMDQNAFGSRFDDIVYMPLLENGLAVDDDLVTLDRNHLACVLVHEVLDPRLQHAGGQLLAYGFLQVGLGDLDVLRQVEYL